VRLAKPASARDRARGTWSERRGAARVVHLAHPVRYFVGDVDGLIKTIHTWGIDPRIDGKKRHRCVHVDLAGKQYLAHCIQAGLETEPEKASLDAAEASAFDVADAAEKDHRKIIDK
jgi:hypothetical protein